MSKAIVAGSINMDIVAFVKDHPKAGETIFGRAVRYFPGGKGSNQAISCRRLGCNTLMVGRIGDDAFGEKLLAFQTQEGIDTSGVRRMQNVATGTAFITVAENSANSIIVISGANEQWDDASFDDLPIESGDIMLAQFEIPDPIIEQAFKNARDYGAMTILNPAPAREISPGIRDLTDILIVNEHELVALSGMEINIYDDAAIFNSMRRLEQDGYHTIIVTLGDKGARLLNAGLQTRINARIVDAIDTTGAGDTFIGGLTAALLSGLALPEALELANIAASISVTRIGAASSIPTRSEVYEVWNNHKQGD